MSHDLALVDTWASAGDSAFHRASALSKLLFVALVLGAILSSTSPVFLAGLYAALIVLVLGAAVAPARPVYLLLRGRFKPGRAGALTAVAALACSVAALYVVIALANRGDLPMLLADGDHAGAQATGRFVLFSSPFWILATVAEALVTSSVLTFLARVRPELLP